MLAILRAFLFLTTALLTLAGCATTSAPKDRLLARATVAGYIAYNPAAKGLPILHLPQGRAILVVAPGVRFEPNEEVILQGQIRMTQGGNEYFQVQKIVARQPRLVAREPAAPSR